MFNFGLSQSIQSSEQELNIPFYPESEKDREKESGMRKESEQYGKCNLKQTQSVSHRKNNQLYVQK